MNIILEIISLILLFVGTNLVDEVLVGFGIVITREFHHRLLLLGSILETSTSGNVGFSLNDTVAVVKCSLPNSVKSNGVLYPSSSSGLASRKSTLLEKLSPTVPSAHWCKEPRWPLCWRRKALQQKPSWCTVGRWRSSIPDRWWRRTPSVASSQSRARLLQRRWRVHHYLYTRQFRRTHLAIVEMSSLSMKYSSAGVWQDEATLMIKGWSVSSMIRFIRTGRHDFVQLAAALVDSAPFGHECANLEACFPAIFWGNSRPITDMWLSAT